MEGSIVAQIVNEIIESCVNGTMPPETIDTITSGDSAADVKEITTQIGEDVHEPIKSDELERDDGESTETSVNHEMSPETLDPIVSGGGSVEAAEERDNKAVVAQEIDIIDRFEVVDHGYDELIEKFVNDNMSPETIKTMSVVDSAAAVEEDIDEEMDMIDQLEGLELDCDEVTETFVDGAKACSDYEETVEEYDSEAIITQIEEGANKEIEIMYQLEALEPVPSNAGDDGIDSTQSTEGHDAHDETRNDEMPSCSSGLQDQCEPERVKKATVVDPLRSKGFATSVYHLSGTRKICNLFLLQNSSKFTPHQVKCEGFPMKMTDYELILLFEKCGAVFCLKRISNTLMFVEYTNDEDANRAVDLFNCRNVQGHIVRVARCLPTCRLIAKGISPFERKHHLLQRFGSVTNGLQSLQLFNDPMCEGRIRRFCYLNYSSYEVSLEAIKRLQRIFPDLSIEYANQRLEWTKTPDTLYISNLRPSMSEQQLLQMFCPYGKITFLKQFRSFAKVQFERVEDANRAASEIDRRRLGNENVDISFDKMYKKRPISRGRNSRQCFNDTRREQMPHESSSDTNRNVRPSSFDIRDRNSRQLTSNMRDRKPRQPSSGTHDQTTRPSTSDSVNRKSRPSSTDVRDHKTEPISSDIGARKSCKSSPGTLNLKNLRPNITAFDLRKHFSHYGEVLTVDKESDSASVQFRKKKNAEQAAEQIDKSGLGDNVQISFVEQTKTSDTLYIYNMFDDMNIKRLRTIFSGWGKVMDVELENGVATVGFRCETNCKRAMDSVNRSLLGKTNVEILFFAKDKQ